MNGDEQQKSDEGNWQYKPADDTKGEPQAFKPAPDAGANQSISRPEIDWTASEFIAHDKSVTWYAVLTLVVICLMTLAYFLFHDIVATVSIIFLGVIFGVLASHKPRVLGYKIDAAGVHIESKVYSYEMFKSFGIVREGAFSNITLMPLKRFSPGLTIYYPPEEEEEIVKTMASYLPMADVPNDAVEHFLRTIHF